MQYVAYWVNIVYLSISHTDTHINTHMHTHSHTDMHITQKIPYNSLKELSLVLIHFWEFWVNGEEWMKELSPEPFSQGPPAMWQSIAHQPENTPDLRLHPASANGKWHFWNVKDPKRRKTVARERTQNALVLNFPRHSANTASLVSDCHGCCISRGQTSHGSWRASGWPTWSHAFRAGFFLFFLYPSARKDGT